MKQRFPAIFCQHDCLNSVAYLLSHEIFARFFSMRALLIVRANSRGGTFRRLFKHVYFKTS